MRIKLEKQSIFFSYVFIENIYSRNSKREIDSISVTSSCVDSFMAVWILFVWKSVKSIDTHREIIRNNRTQNEREKNYCFDFFWLARSLLLPLKCVFVWKACVYWDVSVCVCANEWVWVKERDTFQSKWRTIFIKFVFSSHHSAKCSKIVLTKISWSHFFFLLRMHARIESTFVYSERYV